MYNDTITGELTIDPQLIEKKAIKKASLKIGFTLLAVFGVMFFWSVPVLVVTTLLQIAPERVEVFLQEPIITMLLQAVMMIFMVLVPFLFLARSEKARKNNNIGFAAPKRKIALPFIMAACSYGLIISSLTGVFISIIESIGLKVPSNDLVYPTDPQGIIITVIAIVLMPSLVEEFAMRGVALGMLRRYGDGFAIICSSLVFGLMHASITQIPFAFLLGIVFAVAAIKTESIWTAVILHMLNNGISVGLEYAEIFLGSETAAIIGNLLFLVLVIISVVGTVLLLKRDSQVLKIEAAKTKSPEKKKILYFVLSPTIIVCIIVSVLFGFLLR